MSDPKTDGDSPQPETPDDVLKAVQDSEPEAREVEPMPEAKPVVTPEPAPATTAAAPVPPKAPGPAAPTPAPPRRSGTVLGGLFTLLIYPATVQSPMLFSPSTSGGAWPSKRRSRITAPQVRTSALSPSSGRQMSRSAVSQPG